MSQIQPFGEHIPADAIATDAEYADSVFRQQGNQKGLQSLKDRNKLDKSISAVAVGISQFLYDQTEVSINENTTPVQMSNLIGDAIRHVFSASSYLLVWWIGTEGSQAGCLILTRYDIGDEISEEHFKMGCEMPPGVKLKRDENGKLAYDI